MEWRRRLILLTLVLSAASALGGCGDALTVHRVASALDPAPDVPSIAGHWLMRSDGGDPVGVLQIEGADVRGARCRDVQVTYLEDDDTMELGDQVCFVEFNGHLVAELRSTSDPKFFRQYLVRITDEKIEVCGAHPIWLMLKALTEDRPTGYSLDSLAFTSRDEGDESELLVLVSDRREMREFLELALPELAAACDSGGEDLFKWFAFEKMSPEEEAADAASKAAPED
jgi:hypothetical protein